MLQCNLIMYMFMFTYWENCKAFIISDNKSNASSCFYYSCNRVRTLKSRSSYYHYLSLSSSLFKLYRLSSLYHLRGRLKKNNNIMKSSLLIQVSDLFEIVVDSPSHAEQFHLNISSRETSRLDVFLNVPISQGRQVLLKR